jgi:predicted amidohydrolase
MNWACSSRGRTVFRHEGAARALGVMICFDWYFPEAARSLALRGAQIILHPANLVLPFCQDAMITRCLENRVFAVTANSGGAEMRQGRPMPSPAAARSPARRHL